MMIKIYSENLKNSSIYAQLGSAFLDLDSSLSFEVNTLSQLKQRGTQSLINHLVVADDWFSHLFSGKQRFLSNNHFLID